MNEVEERSISEPLSSLPPLQLNILLLLSMLVTFWFWIAWEFDKIANCVKFLSVKFWSFILLTFTLSTRRSVLLSIQKYNAHLTPCLHPSWNILSSGNNQIPSHHLCVPCCEFLTTIFLSEVFLVTVGTLNDKSLIIFIFLLVLPVPSFPSTYPVEQTWYPLRLQWK